MNQASDRRLGFWMCLALVVGCFIGSGIFLLPAQLAPFGWNALVGWIVTISGALGLAFLFGQLAKALPVAGGPYAYVGEAFGSLPAFVVAWSYWVSLWSGNAALAIATVSYLSIFMPTLASVSGAAAIAAIGMLWILTAINCISVRAGGGFQMVTVILKLVPLVVVVVIAAAVIGRGEPTMMPPFDPATINLSSVNAAAALTLWALLGFETAAVVSRNVKNPARTIPRATMMGTIIVGIIYLLVATPVTMFLPASEVAGSNAPFALFVGHYWSSTFGNLIGLFVAISCLGCLNGLILVQGELPLAMARDGTFPRWFAQTSSNGVAVRAQLVSTALATLLVASNYSESVSDLFVFMALLSTAAALVLYLSCALSAWRLQSHGRLNGPAIVRPVAIFASIYSVWALYGAGYEPLKWGAALLAAGIPIYYLMRASSRASSPVPAVAPAAPRE